MTTDPLLTTGTLSPFFAVWTLGCRVNQYESRALAEGLTASGWEEVPLARADTVIVNVCAVTAKGSRKSRRQVYKLLRDRPGRQVVVMGCMTRDDEAHYRAQARVAAVVPAQARDTIMTLLTGTDRPLSLTDFGHRTRAYVKVQDGCDRFCSYCIVPFLRGRARHRPQAEVIREIQGLFDRGVPEVWVVGTDLAAWNGGDLPVLLRAAGKAARGQGRVRIGTVPLESLDEKLLAVMEEEDGLCRHLHLSLQSGAREIRRRMGRRTPPDAILRQTALFKEALPGLGLTCDVMVGFPGETEAHFQETRALCREVGFHRMHVFPYSDRPGTRAAGMADKVPHPVKRARCDALNELGQALFDAFTAPLMGRTLSVVVEEAEETECRGVSDEYLRVCFPMQEGGFPGPMTSITILDRRAQELMGRGKS